MRTPLVVLAAALLATTVGAVATAATETELSYPVVDSGQVWCFDDGTVIPCGTSHDGQDAQYEAQQPAYQVNGDGTVTDLVTGLMWLADPGEKTTYGEALATLEDYEFAGYDDWRLPTIKELYSLSLWSGLDPSGLSSSDAEGLEPFIDDNVFAFSYGDKSGGARVIDSQWLTSSVYGSEVMNGQSCFFGYNFADGRIKCYPLEQPGGSGGYFALFVRGASDYGLNAFVDHEDGTVSDLATGLTWTQTDAGAEMEWADALGYCQDLALAGADDWRLPSIKELHTLVDYSRSPDTTDSPAIDPLFDLTQIVNENGDTDWGHYWSSTTFMSYGGDASAAAYISFGRALGYMEEFGGWVDVHGAGAQRSDPKVDTGVSYRGPQGDATRSANHVLCVSGGDVAHSDGESPATLESGDATITAPLARLRADESDRAVPLRWARGAAAAGGRAADPDRRRGPGPGPSVLGQHGRCRLRHGPTVGDPIRDRPAPSPPGNPGHRHGRRGRGFGAGRVALRAR